MVTLIDRLQQPRDRPALARHFAMLGAEDLRFRFGYQIGPDGVASYLDALAESDSPAFGVFNPAQELVGLVQLGVTAAEVEVGISVLRPYRRNGLGTALLNRAASYGRSRGIPSMVIVSLADNLPILELARRHGMTVTISCGEAHGVEKLRAATALDYWREVMFDQTALAHSVSRSWRLAVTSRQAED